jgi:hypothetical protein
MQKSDENKVTPQTHHDGAQSRFKQRFSLNKDGHREKGYNEEP